MDISLIDLSLVPIVVGLVQVAKKAGLASKYAPVISVVLGIAGVWVLQNNIEWISGVIIGLSASGLYSGGKTVIGQ